MGCKVLLLVQFCGLTSLKPSWEGARLWCPKFRLPKDLEHKGGSELSGGRGEPEGTCSFLLRPGFTFYDPHTLKARAPSIQGARSCLCFFALRREADRFRFPRVALQYKNTSTKKTRVTAKEEAAAFSEPQRP